MDTKKRMSVRLSEDAHEKLIVLAEAAGRSMTQQANMIILYYWRDFKRFQGKMEPLAHIKVDQTELEE